MPGFLNSPMTIRVRILVVIIVTAVAINVLALAVGALFLNRNITEAMKADMLVTVDIADQYVTKEIELLKYRANGIASQIDLQYRAGGLGEGMLARICADYPDFTGLAVFSRTALLDSCSTVSVPPQLIYEPLMQIAFAGGSVISTTMFCGDGNLVMYVFTSINENMALAAVMRGLHFSELVSHFTFWESGHLFIDDANGYVISNFRREWVEQRVNFIELARTDRSYEDLAGMLRRAIAGERGTGLFSLNGLPRLCAFRPVSSPNEGWFVGVIAPLNESALKNIPNTIMLVGLITLCLSVAAAFIAAAILRRPYEEVDRLRMSAEAVSVSKSTFMANMSHEIRTPMNSILGFSELALDNETSLKTRDYLGKIRTNAQWLLQIINDILDISKVESGKMELEKIPFNMHEMFSSCRALILPKAVEKGITLYFYVEPSIGKRPLGDPTRLRQVLVNLLSNAVKFTNTGMVKLHAVLLKMQDKTITMSFEVKDSGIGMSPEQIEKIFEPFTQAESGTTRKFGGTGLGLTITKNIIELMGGKLAVESTPGIGSKFSFDLVLDTIDVDDDDLLDSKVLLNVLEKPSFEGEILLCEDNLMNQQVICDHLSRVGFQTVVAENGRVGCDLVKERVEKGEKLFDLIFMDMHMPVMDGLEASAEIMKLKLGIPIVALTANIMFEDREIYKKSGMHDCVGKPFTSQELWRCLMKYFTPVSFGKEDKNIQIEAEMEFQKSLNLLFVKNNGKKYAEITDALEQGEVRLAHRLAHSLKSNAGQLGKVMLQKAAAEVEINLKDGKNSVAWEQLMILKTELDLVLNEFAHLVKEPNSNTAQGDFLLPKDELELLEKLKPLLKGGNPECLKLACDIGAIQGSEILIHQMEEFNFESALKTLDNLFITIKKRMDE